MYLYLKYRKRALRYFQNHVEYNAFIHVLGGVGLGILLASPLAFPHPVRWAVVLLGISLLGHLYAVTGKK
ncbi:MAG: hypothetical protein AAB961_00170 [Patescibacteria group bacterium]